MSNGARTGGIHSVMSPRCTSARSYPFPTSSRQTLLHLLAQGMMPPSMVNTEPVMKAEASLAM